MRRGALLAALCLAVVGGDCNALATSQQQQQQQQHQHQHQQPSRRLAPRQGDGTSTRALDYADLKDSPPHRFTGAIMLEHPDGGQELLCGGATLVCSGLVLTADSCVPDPAAPLLRGGARAIFRLGGFMETAAEVVHARTRMGQAVEWEGGLSVGGGLSREQCRASKSWALYELAEFLGPERGDYMSVVKPSPNQKPREYKDSQSFSAVGYPMGSGRRLDPKEVSDIRMGYSRGTCSRARSLEPWRPLEARMRLDAPGFLGASVWTREDTGEEEDGEYQVHGVLARAHRTRSALADVAGDDDMYEAIRSRCAEQWDEAAYPHYRKLRAQAREKRDNPEE